MSHYDKPLAAKGLISYRYPMPGGSYVMIGARDDADALNEARRSFPSAEPDKLERWNGTRYEKVQ